MKRLLAVVILAVMSVLLLSSQDGVIVVSRRAMGGCTTPTGTTLTESFGDATILCWTSGPTTCNNTWTVGASGVSIITSPSGAPDNTACANSLKIVHSSSAAYISLAYASAQTTPVDVYTYIQIVSESLPNSSGTYLLRLPESEIYNNRGYILLYKVSGELYLIGIGVSFSNLVAVSAGTWYKVQIHLESGTNASYLKVNDGTAQTFTQGAQNAGYVTIGDQNSQTLTWVMGVLWAN